MNDEGIFNPLWGIGTLEWKEVSEVYLKSDGSREFACFVVRDRHALKSRLGFLRRIFHTATRATGYGDLTIDAARAGVRAEEAVAFASVKLAAHQ